MGRETAIEWTDATWNPWSGCTKVSPGCAHCYAERLSERFGRDFATVQRAPAARFGQPHRWERELVRRARGAVIRPLRVFTCSMSDFFHEAADAWRADAWQVMRQTPHLIYQVLTKRPERIAAQLPGDWGPHGYPNVWLGVSTEYQRQADERIPRLLALPASLRFVSAEPLLGPLDLRDYLRGPSGVEWVIVGGESGAGHRPLDVQWVRALREQCGTAGVPFFFKQHGGITPRAGGRLLDGREHNGIPLRERRGA